MITYQFTPKLAYQFKTVSELLKQLPYKRYDEITPQWGRGIILRVGDDKDFLVIPYASRNRVCRLLNKLFTNR